MHRPREMRAQEQDINTINHCALLAEEWMANSMLVFGSAGECLVDSTNRKEKTG